MTTLIAFKDRKLSDLLNQKLVELAREAAKFDVDLLASNYRVVPAHRLVLSMYSPYLRRLLKNASPEAKMIGKQKEKKIIDSICNCGLVCFALFFTIC